MHPEPSHHDSPRGLDLRERAERAARDAGFEPWPSPQAQQEAAGLSLEEAEASYTAPVRDMRSLGWSSIDNEESRDLDQVEWCERGRGGSIRVLVGIADVASWARAGSAIDARARLNTASVYAGAATFPMLPERLSNGLTSLLPGQDRLAIVVEMSVAPDGQVLEGGIHRARVRNRSRLVYEGIGDWLDGHRAAPPEVAGEAGLEAQIRLQWEAAQRLRARRVREGALDIERPEARAVVSGGHAVGVQVQRRSAARLIIESFMVAANRTLASFLQERQARYIERVVREPERWPRIVQLAREHGTALPQSPDAPALSAFLLAQKARAPERFEDLSLAILKLLGRGEYAVVRGGEGSLGHFGLGMQRYAHSTAPNRRLPDLITQRILLALLSRQSPPYHMEELEALAARCTEREAAAQKVERLMRKVAMAALLRPRVGEVFSCIVTGASPRGTYVRAQDPPAEGRLIHGERGLDVGDTLRARLASVDEERGFIDFEPA